MSEFLGSQNCIESLRKDLIDLQGATVDVFSRTGPVCFSSWKFPDKLSWSLDMVALLEQYDFVDGENEFNKHSHVVLLELVIDRLLLLLQSFDSFVEQVACNKGGERNQQRGCLSVGLVVRSYWSHLVHFTNLKANSKDVKKQTKSTALDCDVKASVSSSSHQTTAGSACSSSTSSAEFPSRGHLPSCVTPDTPSPKLDRNSVGSQTSESSLLPCDACFQVQSLLRRTGDALIELFQGEGLPSSLQPLLAAVEETVGLGHMTAADVTQWANEQLRDMQRLAKHLQDVRDTVQPLGDRLMEAEAEVERFKTQLTETQEQFKQELEKHHTNIVQLEFSLNKAQRSVKEAEARLQEEQQQHRRETQGVEENNSRLKEEVAAKEDAVRTLCCENNALREKVEKLLMEEETCSKLQQSIQQSEAQISQTQLLLDKEKAKYQGAWRQQESMQAKHQSLLKRVDALYEECEELQGLLGECEDKQSDLLNQLRLMTEEKERVHAQLTEQQGLCLKLRKEKQTLQADASQLRSSLADLKAYVQTLEERERLNPLPARPERILPSGSPDLLSVQHMRTEQNYPTQMALQSSSGTQLGDSRRKTGQWRSDGASAGSEERVSTGTTVPPPYQKRHFQTIDLNLDYMSVKGHIKQGNASVLRRK
ncbi:coiled-coil domain-containing protein 157 [Takifugu rubripes]|uniref:coiled-coil domain-containing protein 157 n=1 Tax=Takifugu rubripes TaxID=31033 RepID=UPI001145BC90|nr:coiled-coil domain-containing protein 157 [Takifugu rubripes]